MIVPSVAFVMLIGVVRALRERVRKPRPQPLCEQCSCAHMQYASSGRAAIFCTFGGGVRPVKVDVMYCADFSQRGVVLRRAHIGFVLPILDSEPDMADAVARK